MAMPLYITSTRVKTGHGDRDQQLGRCTEGREQQKQSKETKAEGST